MTPSWSERILRALERPSPLRSLAPVLAPAVATAIGLVIGPARTAAAALAYLLAVVAVATFAGRWAGIVASVLSFVGLNYFFTPPRRTFDVARFDDLVALVVFLAVGFLVSGLATAGLTERTLAQRREAEARTLYAIATRLLTGRDIDEVMQELAAHVRDLFGLAGCRIMTREQDGTVAVRASNGVAEGTAIEIPLRGSDREMGTLAMFPGPSGLDEAERRVAVILAQQIALTLERAVLEREAREARVAAEAGRLRHALLSAVSHDFRTPLASIKAAITGLLPAGGADATPTREQAEELLRTALEETERLERLVSNLLDLARLRAGAIAPDRRPVAVDDVVEDAIAGVRHRIGQHHLEVKVRDDIPRLVVDPVQVGQVLRNVIENSLRFAPAGSVIRISAASWQRTVEIRVADRGPGIPPPERAAVFEEFYRGSDGSVAGTGLGLAIARGIVRAHGGDIWAEETPGGGATVVLRLPAETGP